jgi:lipoprotein-releasing system ATP-binding protein
VFAILADLVHGRGKTVVAVTHDLELAARMGRRIHLVDGRVVSDERISAAGPPG